jgi:hypothetical protein
VSDKVQKKIILHRKQYADKKNYGGTYLRLVHLRMQKSAFPSQRKEVLEVSKGRKEEKLFVYCFSVRLMV